MDINFLFILAGICNYVEAIQWCLFICFKIKLTLVWVKWKNCCFFFKVHVDINISSRIFLLGMSSIYKDNYKQTNKLLLIQVTPSYLELPWVTLGYSEFHRFFYWMDLKIIIQRLSNCVTCYIVLPVTIYTSKNISPKSWMVYVRIPHPGLSLYDASG